MNSRTEAASAAPEAGIAARPGTIAWLKALGERDDVSAIGRWFWDIDRVLLMMVLLMMAGGLVAVGAASPAAARRLSDKDTIIDPLFFLKWQLIWVCVSLPAMIITSMLPTLWAKRLSLIGAVVCLLLLALVPFYGVVVNGSRRWLDFGVSLVQPSEFMKPYFIVTVAWLLSFKAQDARAPTAILSAVLVFVIAGLLMMQTDLGQTVVFLSVWFAMLMIAGTSWALLGALAGGGLAFMIGAYIFYETARTRIDNWLWPKPGSDDAFQAEAAHNTITAGGWKGTGPAAGEMKFHLPEGHTDYIFSVIGEEFGLLVCIGLALAFFVIVARVYIRLLDEEDEFRFFAAAGLAAQFGLQAFISIAVNTGMAPPKGMTLPFISYGGSSMLALSIGMGLLLAFTRRNPFVSRSPYIARWNSE